MVNPRHPRSTGQRREYRRTRRKEGEPLRPWLAGLGIGALLVFGVLLAYKFLGGEAVFSSPCTGATHIFLVDGGKYPEAEAAGRILDDISAAVSEIATGERVAIFRIGESPEAPSRRIAEFCNSPVARETLREKISEALARPQEQAQSPIVEAIENAERDFRVAYDTPKELRNLHIYSGMVQNSPWWSMERIAAPDWCNLRKFREARNGAVKTLGRPLRTYIWNVDIRWIKHPMDFKWHKNEAELKCFWDNYLVNSTVAWSVLNPLRRREPISNPLEETIPLQGAK